MTRRRNDNVASFTEEATSWLNKVWSGLRRRPEATKTPPSIEPQSPSVNETIPDMVIPSHIMFSPQRARLYSQMLSHLVHQPHYLTSLISHLRHHELDGLLQIILESLFTEPVFSPHLTQLFQAIIESEVSKSTSIDTVMRNDGPSQHILSMYLRTPQCIRYLELAVGPTVETIGELGGTSLDPDPALAYQDWVRTQGLGRLPPVVSAVEAAGYTEVQNLSRRRQQHLIHLATHCLYDVINNGHHIPQNLLDICASTLRAARRRFPQEASARGYGLVGGIFFLRFVNAALMSPRQYGLMADAPDGTMKSNLKLVAKLIQRLSNHSAKPMEEWPMDARRFIRANQGSFHGFLASLTRGAGKDQLQIPDTPAKEQSPCMQQHYYQEAEKEETPVRIQKTTEGLEVVLPLNDLYLVQRYLVMYEDRWQMGEMLECLRGLGKVPEQVEARNNHRTRIPL